MTTQSVIDQVREEVRRRMSGIEAGHGFDHVERVVRNAKMIQREVGGNLMVIELAALLHDIGDAKFHDGEERSGVYAREILQRFGLPSGLINHVVEIVDKISFRIGTDSSELTLEGAIVQDADRLDALGAIGIVRTILYGASIGQPFYVPGDPEAPSGIHHFDEKLFRLSEAMNTDVAKRIAEDREKLMRDFVSRFKAECEG